MSRETRAMLTGLAAQRHEKIDETVARALRTLRPDAIGGDLAIPPTDDDTARLGAEAG